MKKQYWIPSTRYPRSVADEMDMGILLERKGYHWPDEGMGVRTLACVEKDMETKEKRGAKVLVWVMPKVPSATRMKSSKHRAMCACPGCGREMGVGRLAQHVCRGPKTTTDKVVVAMLNNPDMTMAEAEAQVAREEA